MLIRRFSQVGRRANPWTSGASFSPTQLGGLVLWLRADLGITLGGTLLASGTVPPVVTISGTAVTTPGIRLQIDGAGARGAATFKASADNGATFFATGILTAASVPLTGPLTGITAAFAVGAYLTDNIYDATVSQWNDQSGVGNHFAQVTAANQPNYFRPGINGLPALRGGRVTTVGMTNAGVASGTQSSYFFAVNKSTIASSYLQTGSSNNQGILSNFGGVGFEWFNTAPDRYTISNAPAAGLHILAVTQINGGALVGYFDGVQAFSQTATVALTNTTTLMSATTPSNSANSDMAEVLQYNRALTASEVLRVNRYLGARNLVTVA